MINWSQRGDLEWADRVLDLGHNGHALHGLSDRPNEAKAGWRMRWVDGTGRPGSVLALPSRPSATQAECSFRRVTQCMPANDVSRSAKSLQNPWAEARGP